MSIECSGAAKITCATLRFRAKALAECVCGRHQEPHTAPVQVVYVARDKRKLDES